jgi:general secretion pathway protein D
MAMQGGRPQGTGTDEQGQRGIRVTASADERTNTLVVSASPDVLKVIEGVVQELDANPAAEQAVFVYRLKNAQAKNLETVLNNIFAGSGTTSGGTTARQGTSQQGTMGTGLGGFGQFGGGFGGGSTLGGGGAGGRTGIGGVGRTGTGQSGAANQAFGAGRTGQTARTYSRTSGMTATDLAGQVFVVADADTNSLLVTTASTNFDRVKAVIADLDRAVPQVLIKVLIAEVTHENSIDLGVEFSGMNLRASGKGFSAGSDLSVAAQLNDSTKVGGFVFQLDEKNITATIRAIAGVSKLDVLSRPYILTGDNQQASIMVGQTVPIIQNTRTTDTGQTINTITYQDIGIILNVTPHINPQGLVTMDIYPEISELTAKTVPISETVDAPIYAKRFAQSRVAIRDGHTIVIGGLMEDRKIKTEDKVPLLGDIPLLGVLFRRTVEEKSKTELLIFLTPHVAQQPDELAGMSKAEVEAAKIIPNAVEKGAFQEHLKGLEIGASTQPARQEPPSGPAPAVPATEGVESDGPEQ